MELNTIKRFRELTKEQGIGELAAAILVLADAVCEAGWQIRDLVDDPGHLNVSIGKGTGTGEPDS